MTQYKVAELSDALLDAAVALAEGFPLCEEWNQTDYILLGTGAGDLKRYSPSTNWAIGGPIIQREKITIAPYDRVTGIRSPMLLDWCSCCFNIGDDPEGCHITLAHEPLIAAMRAYVIRKLGETVELHD